VVVDYEYHAYKDYASGGMGPGAYDYYAGYDQHDDYGFYGPSVYADPGAMSRGRGPRAAPPRMQRGKVQLSGYWFFVCCFVAASPIPLVDSRSLVQAQNLYHITA